MKFNWATGITISLVAFALMIFYLVFKIMNSNEKLVTDRPYEDGLAYNQIMDRQQRSLAWQHKFKAELTSDGICIRMQDHKNVSPLTGKLTLYRPQGDKPDMRVNLELDSMGRQCVSKLAVGKGRWKVVINWSYKDKPFLWQQEVYIP